MPLLQGIKVLDLTRLTPGNFCSMVLGDLGADVIKIEEPGRGDYMRWTEPMRVKQSVYFTIYNRNKRSMTINLKTPIGQRLLRELVKGADVILEGFSPGVAKRLGADYGVLSQINEGLIYCSLSGYGQNGPYSGRFGHDINYVAVAGLLHLTGSAESAPPISPGIPIADFSGALYCVIGVLAALFHRAKSGVGQYMEVSMVDSVVSLLGLEAARLFFSGENVKRGQTFSGGATCNSVFTTSDGKYITLGIFEDKHWRRFCNAIGRSDLTEMDFRERKEGSKLYNILRDLFFQKNRSEWNEILLEANVCFEPVLDLEEALSHPQILHREMVLESTHPTEGRSRDLGFPLKFKRTPLRRKRHAPNLGEHTEEILTELGYCVEEISSFRQEKII